MSADERKILDALREHPDATMGDLPGLTGLSESRVWTVVPELQRNGVIERHERGWRIAA